MLSSYRFLKCLNQDTKGFPDDISDVKSPDQSFKVATLALRSPPPAKVRANSPQHKTYKLVSCGNENKVWFLYYGQKWTSLNMFVQLHEILDQVILSAREPNIQLLLQIHYLFTFQLPTSIVTDENCSSLGSYQEKHEKVCLRHAHFFHDPAT